MADKMPTVKACAAYPGFLGCAGADGCSHHCPPCAAGPLGHWLQPSGIWMESEAVPGLGLSPHRAFSGLLSPTPFSSMAIVWITFVENIERATPE